MALDPKTLATGGVITALGGGAVAGGVILSQKGETIGDLVTENLLFTEQDYADRLSSKKDDEKSPKNTGKELKQWCEETSKEIANEENKKTGGLLEEYKKWCTFTIKQKINNALRTSNEEDSNDWKIKTKNLKDYEKPTPRAEFELTEIEEKKKEIEKDKGADAWKKLRDWCKEADSKNYEKENNLWKLANKFCTKATIKDALHGTELLVNDDLKTEWASKVTKAKVANDGLKDPSIKDHLSASEDATNSKKLQEWCDTQYKKHHDVEETWETTKVTVLNEVKKWCVLTVKEKLEETKNGKKGPIEIEESNEQSNWTNNFTSLTSHSEAESEPIKLNDSLKTAKKDTSNGWQKLKDWCKFIYEKGYRGDNMDWKLADKFCRQKTE